jgi:plastocyanin
MDIGGDMVRAIGGSWRRLGVAAMFVVLAAGGAYRHAGAAPPATVRVEITKFAFAPKEVTVQPGTRVIWTNRDETPHTVSSNDKSFASKGMDTDDTFEQTFAQEGDYPYVCTVHPFMTGVVHVHKQ